jgi:hypothetical protein
VTAAQEAALRAACDRYRVAFDARHYAGPFDLPPGWLAGWLGGPEIQPATPTIFVGCSPEGGLNS